MSIPLQILNPLSTKITFNMDNVIYKLALICIYTYFEVYSFFTYTYNQGFGVEE